MDFVKFIYRPLAARAARQVLIGRNRARQSPDRARFTRADVDRLLKAAWLSYSKEVGKIPVEPTIGSRDERKAGLLHNVVLQCSACDRYRAGIRDRARRGCSLAGLSALVHRRTRAGLP